MSCFKQYLLRKFHEVLQEPSHSKKMHGRKSLWGLGSLLLLNSLQGFLGNENSIHVV